MEHWDAFSLRHSALSWCISCVFCIQENFYVSSLLSISSNARSIVSYCPLAIFFISFSHLLLVQKASDVMEKIVGKVIGRINYCVSWAKDATRGIKGYKSVFLSCGHFVFVIQLWTGIHFWWIWELILWLTLLFSMKPFLPLLVSLYSWGHLHTAQSIYILWIVLLGKRYI